MSYKPDVIIVDNHQVFRQGLISVVSNENIATVISEADSGNELIDILSNLNPDLILMDIDVPANNGIDAIEKTLQLKPGLKIIVFSSFDDQEYFHQLISLGVKGFILKSSSISDLEHAIQDVMMGKSHFSSLLLEKIKNNFNRKNKTDRPDQNNRFLLPQ